MVIKYYTHFLVQERSSSIANEYRGVIEVNRPLSGDMKEAASMLARNVKCESNDIQIMHFSRVH